MKKGFTLIELLAVILILGIIALIAIPTVNNILEEARMGAFKTSVSQVAKSAEQNCQLQQLRNENITGNINFTNGEPSINLEYKGDGPDAGYMNVTNDCGVTFAVADTRYCAVKETVEDDIKIGKLENGVCKINEIEYSLENVNYTPEECFVFDSSTGTIKEYLCGMKYNSSTSSYEAAANYYPDVVIPKTINGVQVKKIGDNAFCTWYVDASNGFSDNYIYSKINSIVFPNTLISIGEYAFADNNVSYFKLPSSLEYIGAGAFSSKNIITIELGHLAKDFSVEDYEGLFVVSEYCSGDAANAWKIKYNKSDNKYEEFIFSEYKYLESSLNVEDFSTYKIYNITNNNFDC